MIQFQKQYSLKNGNKLNRKNWHRVVARANEPCTHVHGVPEIEEAKRTHGAYFQEWRLVKEKEGYIFRERFSNTGICGHWPTYRKAIWAAVSNRNQVFLLEENEGT